MEKFITSDKVFHHLDKLSAWKSKKIIGPVTLEIHPSNKCNNFCYYCSAAAFKDGHLMKLDDLKSAIKKICLMGARGLIFSGGGEPLCNPATVTAIEYAKSMGLSVGLITNGAMITEKNSTTLLRSCEWIRISLDSLSPQIYKKIRGVNGLPNVERSLKILLKHRVIGRLGCTIGVQVVVNKYNCKEIYRFAKIAEAKFKNLDYVQIRPLEVSLNKIPYSRKDLSHIRKELDLIKKDKTIRSTIISTKWDLVFGKREHGFAACHCYPMIGAVDAYGDIYMCCHMIRQPSFKYGNILTDSLANIFKKRELVAGRTIKNKLHALCPVGCRGSAINRRLEGLLAKKEHANFL